MGQGGANRILGREGRVRVPVGAMPLVVTCAQCREMILEADLIGDEEECLLRDHLLAVHPNTGSPGRSARRSGTSSTPNRARQ
jgi:hypothetical protein